MAAVPLGNKQVNGFAKVVNYWSRLRIKLHHFIFALIA